MSNDLKVQVQETSAWIRKLRDEVGRVIVGQEALVERLLVGLLANGHVLLEGVPGLAKTLLIRTLAQVLDLKFNRIQFTPDLMPSDITGTDIIQEDPATGARQMMFAPGPIFANIVLADEINRTPPKTQAALLEAMQEHRVTIQGRTYTLDEPFYVFATQNPIELEGTYPLPEAQLDRFMFHIVIEHPPEDEEFEVVRTTTAILDPKFQRPVTGGLAAGDLDLRQGRAAVDVGLPRTQAVQIGPVEHVERSGGVGACRRHGVAPMVAVLYRFTPQPW